MTGVTPNPQGTAGPELPRDRLLDELATRATVSPIDRTVDGWYAKAAPDLPFRRCNAVLPARSACDRGSASVASTARALERWYGALGQRVIVQVSSADPGGDELDRFLAARGYEIEAPVQVMVRDLSRGAGRGGERARSSNGAPSLAVQVTDGIDGAWARRYAEAHGGDEVARQRTYAYGRMLETTGDRVLAASATVDRQPAGVGLGVLDEGWLGIFGMGTGAGHRRSGVAAAVATALLDRARVRGATGAYLQVETANAPALRLYAALGFTPSHRYHYRVSAPA